MSSLIIKEISGYSQFLDEFNEDFNLPSRKKCVSYQINAPEHPKQTVTITVNTFPVMKTRVESIEEFCATLRKLVIKKMIEFNSANDLANKLYQSNILKLRGKFIKVAMDTEIFGQAPFEIRKFLSVYADVHNRIHQTPQFILYRK